MTKTTVRTIIRDLEAAQRADDARTGAPRFGWPYTSSEREDYADSIAAAITEHEDAHELTETEAAYLRGVVAGLRWRLRDA